LLDVVAAAHAVAAHAVEHDFTGAALLYLGHPVERAPAQRTRACRIAGVLTHAPGAVLVAQAVDADDHALHAEGIGQFVYQRGTFQCRRIDRHLVGTGMQHATRILDAADASGNAERNVDDASHAFDPVTVHRAPAGAG